MLLGLRFGLEFRQAGFKQSQVSLSLFEVCGEAIDSFLQVLADQFVGFVEILLVRAPN